MLDYISYFFFFCPTFWVQFNDDSDVDFSVVFHYEQIHDLFITFFDFIDELQHLLGRKVDMVDETAVKNQIFRTELDRTKQLIYG